MCIRDSLYLAGGNIAECLISGWTAGRGVAAEPALEAVS